MSWVLISEQFEIYAQHLLLVAMFPNSEFGDNGLCVIVVSFYFLGNQTVKFGENGFVCSVGTGGRGCIDVILCTCRCWKAHSEIGKISNSRWMLLLENPVYEIVKFFQEPKMKKIHEKIYNNIVISTV